MPTDLARRQQDGVKRWCVVCRKVRALVGGRYAPHLIPWTENPCPLSGKPPREVQPPEPPGKLLTVMRAKLATNRRGRRFSR